MTAAVVPPGWPAGVHPPGTEAWERSAESWLLDQGPPEHRSYPVLRRHLVLLARFTVVHVEAQQAGVRRGLSAARGDLRGLVDDDVAEAAVETWLCEDARLAALRREVGLVEEAVRGRRFRAAL